MAPTDTRVVVLTGATGVVGTAVAKKIASGNDTLILAVRNVEKGEELKKKLLASNRQAKISVLEVNMLSLKSIRDFAARLLELHPRIDVLINNAGAHFPSKSMSEDKIEATIAVNVVGYVFLLQLLQSALIREKDKNGQVSPSHVINMCTNVADEFDMNDLFFDERAYSGLRAFKHASGAIRTLTHFLGNKLASSGIVVNAVHPGTITSPLLAVASFSRGLDTEDDIGNNVCVALEGGIETAGKYYRDGKLTVCEFSFDTDLAEQLLKRVQQWVVESGALRAGETELTWGTGTKDDDKKKHKPRATKAA